MYKNLYKYRLHLYDGSYTPWFLGQELSLMVKKHEGRIIAIAKEDYEHPEDVHPA